MSNDQNEKETSKAANTTDASVLMNVRLSKMGIKYDSNGFGYADDFNELAPNWLTKDGCLYKKTISAIIRRLMRAKQYNDAKSFVDLLEDIAQDYPDSISEKLLNNWKEEAQEPASAGMLVLNIIIMLLVIVNLAMMVTMLFNKGQIPWMSGFLNMFY